MLPALDLHVARGLPIDVMDHHPASANAQTGLDLPLTLGALNPTGHIVMALPGGDAGALKTRSALLEAGISAADIQHIEGERMLRWLELQLDATSAFAKFGSEVDYMERFLERAYEGAGWLIVKAPDDETRERITHVAQRHGVKLAVKYNSLAHEELPVRPGVEPKGSPNGL